MRAHKGLLMRYLGSVEHVLEKLARERDPGIAPATSIFLLILLVSVAAFTSPFPLRPGSFLPLLMAIVLSLASRELGAFLRLAGIASFFLAVVSLPLLFITPGTAFWTLRLGPLELSATWDGAFQALAFALRCLNAVCLAVAWTSYVGFNNLIRGLHVIDPTGTIPSMVFLTTRYVPLSIREAQKLIAAREARTLREPRLNTTWLLLASSCGDLFLRTFHRAWKVNLAMKSRCLSGSLTSLTSLKDCFRLGARDVLWALLALAYVLVMTLRVI